jgi:hypothetical protein
VVTHPASQPAIKGGNIPKKTGRHFPNADVPARHTTQMRDF